MKHIFGPVISRRLGRSLGIDVVPFKTCTYDCVYCQLGPTTCRTTVRAEYVPLNAIVQELREILEAGTEADYISIAGSGEPTLYSRLADLIDAVKTMTAIPVALITNGSLFWRDDVREAVRRADLILPSLDVGTAAAFTALNRPDPAITFERMVAGLLRLRESFSGKIWLEVFLLGPVSAEDTEILRLKTLVDQIRPDRVQLNTLARPAPGAALQPANLDQMASIARFFGPTAEIIATQGPEDTGPTATAGPDALYDVIRRHPCTLEELARGLGVSVASARDGMERLLAQNRAAKIEQDGAVFYVAL